MMRSLVLVAALWALAGCGSDGGGQTGSARLLNLLLDGAALDFCLSGKTVTRSTSYPEVTAHVPLPPGNVVVAIAAAGGSCDEPLATVRLDADRSRDWSLVATGAASGENGWPEVALVALADDFARPPSGLVRARAFLADPEAGVLDLGRVIPGAGTARLFLDLRFGAVAAASPDPGFSAATGYASLPPVTGPDTAFGAFRHGSDRQLVAVAGPQFEPDHVYSIYPIGAAVTGQPPAELLVCDDTFASTAQPAGCRAWPAVPVR